ncbi:MAG: transcription elongation factor GreA [Eubacteriales bacterium]|nr:transcription elongation factor GreA [Eubacteriales bacterium]
MVENKEIVLTKDGMAKLREELEYLKTEKRKEVSEKIKEARSFGDLSENAEYDEAKNEQAEVESRINTIVNMLKYARVIDDSEIANDTVGLGVTVVIREVGEDDEETYAIVTTTETDPVNNKISQDSPVGSALMGHKVGDTVTVDSPAGKIDFEIVSITKNV